MRHRKRAEHHGSHERWLVSYADFITLLFAFFVVMYSSAQVDKQKVGKLALSIQVAFDELGVFPGTTIPVTPPAAPLAKPSTVALEDLVPLRHELEQSLQKEIA